MWFRWCYPVIIKASIFHTHKKSCCFFLFQVIDPDIPPDGILVKGERIKAPSDEVMDLQTKDTYLVRFFDGRRTW